MEIVLTKRRECSSIKLDIHFQEMLTEEQIATLCKKLLAKCRNFGDLVFIEFSGGRITASASASFLTIKCDNETVSDLVIAYLKEL